MASVEDPNQPGAAPDAGEATRTMSWLTLARWGAIGQIVVIVLINVLGGEIIPPLIVFGVLLGVGAAMLGRPGKVGPIVVLVISLLHLVLSAPFSIPTLFLPASWGDFVLTVASIVYTVLAIVGAIGALRSDPAARSGAPRRAWTIGLAVLALSILIAAVSAFTFEDDEFQEGDVRLTAADIEFDPTTLEAEAGEVTVFIENEDSTYHTFTSEDLDVDEAIPAGAAVRVTFTVDGAGTYEFECTPHAPDMSGELVVR